MKNYPLLSWISNLLELDVDLSRSKVLIAIPVPWADNKSILVGNKILESNVLNHQPCN
jgi:hypothetical protein